MCSQTFETELLLTSPDATAQLAQTVSAALRPGDVLLLSGGIGAGKTHFARCLIQSLMDAPEDVPSPTFTLVQEYETPSGPIWHADLYRLTNPLEAIELGLEEAFVSSICLIEWPDRLGDLVPPGALTLDFDTLDDQEGARRLTIRATKIRKNIREAISHGAE